MASANPSSQSAQDQQDKTAINRQIAEIKKKIQLSEGQRKATFEISEAERKSNADEIIRLKKEIGQLLVTLHEERSDSVKDRTLGKRLDVIVGPTAKKTCSQIVELLDLQIIDRSKQLDLLRYKIKKRQKYLAQLGTEYQSLVSETALRDIAEKIDKPVKKSTRELQNGIHAVELQQREADHVKIRYRDVRKTLQDDAARFESTIRDLEERLRAQDGEIARLERINLEASRMRSLARRTLLKEERAAQASAVERERRQIQGQQMVERCRDQLEKLEKHIFQGGRSPTAKQEDDRQQEAAGDEAAAEEEQQEREEEEDEEDKEEGVATRRTLAEVFQVLMEATGGVATEEVLAKFRAQKATLARLTTLRATNEAEKEKLEARKTKLSAELEKLKYLEAKETETNAQQMERLQYRTEEQRRTCEECKENALQIAETLRLLVLTCQRQHLAINPRANVSQDHASVVKNIKADLHAYLVKRVVAEAEVEDQQNENEEKWFPPPYCGLLTKTPQPQQGASPAPPVSDEEEDVPSRGFLKRQAQLVVDAKMRKKMLSKRK